MLADKATFPPSPTAPVGGPRRSLLGRKVAINIARRKVVPTTITTLLQLALPIVDVTDRMKDALAGTKDMEEEADYVGLYLAARAGFDLEKGVNAWRKMGTYDPRMIELARSHPLPGQRYVTMEAAIAEIKAKRAKVEPLVPNMKK